MTSPLFTRYRPPAQNQQGIPIVGGDDDIGSDLSYGQNDDSGDEDFSTGLYGPPAAQAPPDRPSPAAQLTGGAPSIAANAPPPPPPQLADSAPPSPIAPGRSPYSPTRAIMDKIQALPKPALKQPSIWRQLAATLGETAVGAITGGRKEGQGLAQTVGQDIRYGPTAIREQQQYGSDMGDLQTRLNEAKEAEATESQRAVRESQELKNTADAEALRSKADPHFGLVSIDSAKLPPTYRSVLQPDRDGKIWLPRANAQELEKELNTPLILKPGEQQRDPFTGSPIGSAVPEKAPTQTFEEQRAETNAKVIAAAHPELNLDTTKPILAQLPPQLQQEAQQTHVSPAEQENVAHWVATINNPKATPQEKSVAQSNLDLLRKNTVGTRVDVFNQTSPGVQPDHVVKRGSHEDDVAHQLADGRLTYDQFIKLYSRSRDPKIREAIEDRAIEINPAFAPSMAAMGYKFATNPKTMMQLASINNVESGVNDLLKASDLASRSGATILNHAIIPGGVAVGSKAYSNFEAARTAFADELSGALGYGSATDMSRQMGFDMTDKNLSPENFRAAVNDIIVPFLARKRASITGQMGVYGNAQLNPAVQGKNGATGGSSAPKLTQIHNAADYAALPKGPYLDPNGIQRNKP